MNIPLHRGISLLELMITIAIISVLAAIAIPLYDGYIREGHLASMRSTMNGLRTIMEDYRLENGDYGPGANGFSAIDSTYGWDPSGDPEAYSFAVSATTNTYNVWGVFNSNTEIWVRCDNRFSNCCDPDTTGATVVTDACP